MQPLIFFVVLLIEVVEIIFQYYNTKRIAKKTGKVREVAGECFSILEEIVTNLHLVIISKCKLSFWKKLISEEKIFKKNCIELDTTIEMNRNISIFAYYSYNVYLSNWRFKSDSKYSEFRYFDCIYGICKYVLRGQFIVL